MHNKQKSIYKSFLFFIILITTLLIPNSCEENLSEQESDSINNTNFKVYSGKKLKKHIIIQHLKNAGFNKHQIPTMICIAKWESSFYEKAKHINNNGSVDYGLFQINNYWWGTSSHGGCEMTTRQLLDARQNCICARKVFRRHGYRAWYAFKKHRKECLSYKI